MEYPMIGYRHEFCCRVNDCQVNGTGDPRTDRYPGLMHIGDGSTSIYHVGKLDDGAPNIKLTAQCNVRGHYVANATVFAI